MIRPIGMGIGYFAYPFDIMRHRRFEHLPVFFVHTAFLLAMEIVVDVGAAQPAVTA